MGDISIIQLAGTDTRRARIRKLCQDHAWRFHQFTPGSEARYVIEGYVPGATSEDWGYAVAYVRTTPQLFDGTFPQLQPREIAERDAACRDRLSVEARAAFDAGNYPLALAMVDDAEWFAPLINGEQIRALIRSRMGGAA